MEEIACYQMLIDGRWVDAEDGCTFESFNPATGAVWARIPQASEADVDEAVKAAHRALRSGPWSRMNGTERGRLLRRLAELLSEESEKLGRIETLDTGKMFKETRWQSRYVGEYFHYFAGLADKIQGDTLPIDKPDMFACTIREPIGVIAAIVPWNSQLFLSSVKLGPALAAGNTVVLKASEHASAPMLEFGRLFEKAGFPPGVVNVVTGFAEPCGRVLTSHPLVSRISFTGGIPAARSVIRNSAENLAEVSLELGGKSPVIVFSDADTESAVNGVMAGIFGASGQSCVAGSRLYLEDRIADDFLDRLCSRARAIRLGDPMLEETQMGPLATPAQISNIEKNIGIALEQGGKLLTGGKQPRELNRGWYFEPSVVECPRNDNQILRTELFGPVLSVMRFTSEEEAITLANDSEFALAAGVFTRDSAKSLRVARSVQAGILWVNTYRVVSPIAEFGGFRNSGHGREGGLQAVYDYTRTKTLWMNTSAQPIGNPFVMR